MVQRGIREKPHPLTTPGNSLLRYLWTEAVMHAVQKDAKLKRFYRRKLIQKGMGKARIAAARNLGIWLWIMMRDQSSAAEESCGRAGKPMRGCSISTVVLRGSDRVN
jgi:hypothetical protein